MAEKNQAYRIITLITTPKLADKATKVLSREGLSVENRLPAVGTATSKVVDILGLGSIDKTVLFSIAPRYKAHGVLKKLSKELILGNANSGIAFTVPLSGMSNFMVKMLAENETQQEGKDVLIVSEEKYSLIAAVVNRGYSNDVMDAAREAGASGGSVINSRRIADELVCNKWGLGSAEEKEIVLVVAHDLKKADIMSKMTEKCGLKSEAKGFVFSVPIDEVAGL